MAKTIPQLTDATTVNAADELIVQQGGITKRATATELGQGLTPIVNAANGTVSVKDFGAVGDGMADDTAAIQAALNAARDSGKPVYGPAGNYLVTSTINIECSGDMSAMIILANATSLSPVVRLGKVSGFPVQSLQIRLPAITNTARVAGDGWVGYQNSIGLTVDNIMDSVVTVAQINGFGIGASIGGTDSGNQTNQYFIPFIYRCRLALLVDRKSVNGWSNENTYYIGRFRKDSNEARVISGITAAASTDTFTKAAHGLTNGTAVAFTTLTGGSGLTADTLSYFVVGATANTFQVSETSGGSPVDILTDYSDATISYPWPDTACIKLGNVNNNVFIRPCVETSMAVDERALILEDSSYNLFISPRYEILRSGTARLPVLLKGTIGSACTGNCFLAGLDFTTTGAVYAVDAAVTNAVYANTVIGNGRSEQAMSPMSLQNSAGNGLTTPHLQGVTAGDNALNVSDSFSEWLYRLHGSGLNGKRKADAHSRLRLDWNASNGTGRVFFGDGTVDPTTYITGNQTNLDLVGYSNVRNDGATYTLNQAGTAVIWRAGAGSPEGAVTANVGSIFSRTNGGGGTTLYVKESGSGNTGWVAK